MSIRENLRGWPSKTKVQKLADEIAQDSDQFAELVELMLEAKDKTSQYAAWLFSHCTDKQPALIYPHLARLAEELSNPVHHDGIRRSILRAIPDIELPEPLWGTVADQCFRYVADPHAPAAIRVFAMSALGNICRQAPELREELKLIIEDQWDYATAGFRARAKKVLREIDKQ